MSDINDYEDAEDSAVDEDEAKAAESGAADEEASSINDTDIAEAETLTVTAKQKQRQALEDEVAAFLARGGELPKFLQMNIATINPKKHHMSDAFFIFKVHFEVLSKSRIHLLFDW